MNQFQRYELVLALYPNTRGFAFVLFQGHLSPFDWGVDICEILKNNGTTIDADQGYLVVPEFYEWFHTHVFCYHSSAIAGFLNNIRWGIYDYLRPECRRSYTKDDPSSYRFIYPPDCERPVAQTMYWDLMNTVRAEPYMPKFVVTRYL